MNPLHTPGTLSLGIAFGILYGSLGTHHHKNPPQEDDDNDDADVDILPPVY